jgi:protein TonB
VKTTVQTPPVFLWKAGVFYFLRSEKKRVITMIKGRPNKTNSRSLHTLLGVSLGIHLLLFSAGFLIVADVTVNPGRVPPIEVSLLPPALSPVAVEKRLKQPMIPAEEKPLHHEAKQEIPREEPVLKTASEPERTAPLQAAVPTVQAIHPPPLPAQQDNEAPLPSPMEAVSTPTPAAKREPVRMAMAYSVSRESTSIVLPAAPPTDPPTASSSPSLPERSASLPASPPSDERIRVAKPRYGENPNAVYPPEARKKGHQGKVLLRVQVLTNGRVGDVELEKSSGHEILDRSALAAVKQWKFIPAREGEKTVAVWVTIPVRFQLQ